MPTNKAPFKFHLDEIILLKIKYLAKKETRSASNLLEHLCKMHITEYESRNGEIGIEEL